MTIGLHGIRVSESSAAAQEAERLAGAANIAVWRFDLDGVRTKSDLLAVIGRVLGMPDYFGSNWDAVEECLRDFDEGKGWLLIFEHADSILALPRQDLTVFGEILSSTAEFWSAEKRTFAAHFVGSHVLKAALQQVSSTGTNGYTQ
ncbi:MAG: barstar family protein [Acidobacteriaceae bacterium]|jgi:hypothetical protein|nr:barstar family protein [Acidobacteriaceae bacterium]